MIRMVTADDYEALAELNNAVFPEDKYTADEHRYLDNVTEPPCKSGRLVAFQENELVGSAKFNQFIGMYHPQKFFLELFVHHESQGQGIGSRLYEALLEKVKPFDPISLRAQVRESDSHALRFAKKRGFKETKRDWEAVFEPAGFDSSPYEALCKRLEQESYTFKSLADLGNSEDVQRQFHRLFLKVRQDVPRSEPATPIDWEAFKKLVLDAPDFFPEGTFFALKGKELVALTMFWRSEAADDLYTGLTGVKREHRAKGLATALKVVALNYAASVGAKQIFTDNDTNNVEMIAINDKLGFRRLPARLSMLMNLKEDTE